MPDIRLTSPDSRLDDILSIYKLLLSSDFGIWMWETDTDKLYFNANYMKMLGYGHDAFPFHISTWAQLIHPEDHDATVGSQRALIQDASRGDTFESRFRMRNVAGDYVRILGKGFVLLRDAGGRALRISGMHIDLNKMEQTLEMLATEHDRMSFALEAAKDGLWDWNTETEEVYFSPRYISMLGYTPEEFPPTVTSWSKRVHPDDLETTVHKQYAHISDPAQGDLFECVYRFLAADGTYKWILGRGKVTRRDASGRGTRLVGLHTDITELRNTQENLSRLLNLDTLTRLYSRYFLDATLDTLQDEDYPVSILFADVDGLKLINDNLGHAVGDKLLITTASLLRESVGRNTVAARLGGDEFAILLRACPLDKAEKLRAKIESVFAAYRSTPDAMPVFISLGLLCTTEPTPPHVMLARADEIMLGNKAVQRAQSHEQVKAWIKTQTGKPVISDDARLA